MLNQRQSIQTVLNKQSDVKKREYQTRLNASVDCIFFLQQQGLAFHGHDESKDSNNQGNFLELLMKKLIRQSSKMLLKLIK